MGMLSLGPLSDRRSYGILGGRVSVRSASGRVRRRYAFGSGGRRLRMRKLLPFVVRTVA